MLPNKVYTGLDIIYTVQNSKVLMSESQLLSSSVIAINEMKATYEASKVSGLVKFIFGKIKVNWYYAVFL